MKKIFLIENHDEALKLWRRQGVKNIDLIHVDAHLDYAVHPARPAQIILEEAASLSELKEKLEYTLAFQKYQTDLNRQTDIGNYIYTAMREGVVRHFTWVIPGRAKDFTAYAPAIKETLRAAARAKNRKARIIFQSPQGGMLVTSLENRVFCVCVLEALPEVNKPVLLDIDADFLVIPSILKGEHTQDIGRRKPWIGARALASALSSKIKNPACLSIAYSTAGGWTPMSFRYLALELAQQFAPGSFKKRYQQQEKAALSFNRFVENGLPRDYRRALRYDPELGAWDNNYGPLYLAKGRFYQAAAEFQKILRVDLRHAAALWGMGVLAKRKKDYPAARKWFLAAWQASKRRPIFRPHCTQILLALAEADFLLKNFKSADKKLRICCRRSPLEPKPRYWLGCLAQARGDYEAAAVFYRQAIQLGYEDEKPIMSLLKIVKNLRQKDGIIKYLRRKRADFGRNFSLLKRRQNKNSCLRLTRMEKVLNRLDRQLKEFKK